MPLLESRLGNNDWVIPRVRTTRRNEDCCRGRMQVDTKKGSSVQVLSYIWTFRRLTSERYNRIHVPGFECQSLPRRLLPWLNHNAFFIVWVCSCLPYIRCITPCMPFCPWVIPVACSVESMETVETTVTTPCQWRLFCQGCRERNCSHFE